MSLNFCSSVELDERSNAIADEVLEPSSGVKMAWRKDRKHLRFETAWATLVLQSPSQHRWLPFISHPVVMDFGFPIIEAGSWLVVSLSFL